MILGERSKKNLIGVNPQLVQIVEKAITITKVDFAVTEGLRTVERQKELVAKGASTTMNSKHITGHAVDLVAYLDGRISWELNLYDDIADAMRAAASELKVPIRWGAAWHIKDITTWPETMEKAMLAYIDLKRKQGERPFIDAPHFELSI